MKRVQLNTKNSLLLLTSINMSYKLCCVPGCGVTDGEGIPLHSFPNPITEYNRFKVWVSKCAVKIEGKDDLYIFSNRRVCHQHFTSNYYYPKSRLCKLAIPMLNLPGLTQENNESFPNTLNHEETNPIVYEGLESCRVCAVTAAKVFPIFDGRGEQDELLLKINQYLPIKVSKEDGLPQIICHECWSTIMAWDKFVKCSIQAELMLQQKLSGQFLDSDRKPKQEQIAESAETTSLTDPVLSCLKNENVPTIVHQNGVCQRTEVEPRVVTKDGKKYNTCGICKKNVSVASWKRHFRSHQSVKRYSCHTCGLGFNDSGNLSRHRRALHAAHRPHKCHICNKSFSRNSHLEDHVKSHSDDRDYVCDVCGKASKSSAALRMHRKIHENEFRFRCIYCEAKFRRRAQLQAHVSVHTGEKSHVCSCGKAFRLKGQLTVHARTHNRVRQVCED